MERLDVDSGSDGSRRIKTDRDRLMSDEKPDVTTGAKLDAKTKKTKANLQLPAIELEAIPSDETAPPKPDFEIREMGIDDLAPVYHLGERLFTSDRYPSL